MKRVTEEQEERSFLPPPPKGGGLQTAIFMSELTDCGLRTEGREKDEQIRELQRTVEMDRAFDHYISSYLAALPCCHEPGTHKDTPPMMWPELIGCIIKRAVKDVILDREGLERDLSTAQATIAQQGASIVVAYRTINAVRVRLVADSHIAVNNVYRDLEDELSVFDLDVGKLAADHDARLQAEARADERRKVLDMLDMLAKEKEAIGHFDEADRIRQLAAPPEEASHE